MPDKRHQGGGTLNRYLIECGIVQPDAGAAQRRRKSDAELRRSQIAQLRIDSAAEIAHRFGVSLRTAQADLAAVRSATTQRNGAVH